MIWAITSSALRAPPLTLLGKHRAKPQIPFLSALAMLGYGLAGAVSPYLGVVLRKHDARLPFVISSVVLLITALALSGSSAISRDDAAGQTSRAGKAARHGAGDLHRLDGHSRARLSTAFLHQQRAVLSALRQADDLQWLMPVFWIGFNIAMFPASVVVKHRGGLIVMGAAGLLGRAGDPWRGDSPAASIR